MHLAKSEMIYNLICSIKLSCRCGTRAAYCGVLIYCTMGILACIHCIHLSFVAYNNLAKAYAMLIGVLGSQVDLYELASLGGGKQATLKIYIRLPAATGRSWYCM